MIRFRPLAILLVLCGMTAAARGQDEVQPFNIGSQFNIPGLDGLDGENVTLTGDFTIEEGSTAGRLSIHAKIAPNWHIYSITQEPGGPQASILEFVASDQVQLTGKFEADRDPEAKKYEFWEVAAEEHGGEVTWSVPFALSAGADPEMVELTVKYSGQVCTDGGACIPLEQDVVAQFAGFTKPADGVYAPAASHGSLEGFIDSASASPGQTIKLVIKGVPESPYHFYKYAAKPLGDNAYYKPTHIALTKRGDWVAGPVTADDDLIVKHLDLKGALPLEYYKGVVTWTMDLKVPKDAAGDYTIAGVVGYQTCTDQTCDGPVAAVFEATIQVGDGASADVARLRFTETTYDVAQQESIKAANRIAALQPEPIDASKLAVYLAMAFAGGLILNLMPCVLPVIGLKVLSFAEQAGNSRMQILKLNLSFSLGLIAVFLILATLSAFLNMGWGQQFTLSWFKIGMVSLVFAMALSFLGVWEIPIPGFVGSGKSNELQAKEGLSGAFFKGVFTTILATPCSGPFLGSVFGFTLNQPAALIYLLFGAVGVGMASPYLLIGAFPALVNRLPKPGAWMETFKQFMGFVLLGTVVFLFISIKAELFLPTLALLVGIWFACWLIGRQPFTASGQRKLVAWVSGIAVAAAVGVFSYEVLGPHEKVLPWQPYSSTALSQAQAEGKTVLVDFTADWCATCKVNLKLSIDTEKVKAVVEQNGVVPMLADWTDESEEIKSTINGLGFQTIPLLVIYPAGKPNDVIVLKDTVTQTQVIEALERAGPSKGSAQTKVAAVTGSD